MTPRVLVNIVTFSRIIFAILLVIGFQPNAKMLGIAFSALVLAFISDLADGFLARRFHVASFEGQFWDSLADKAVYIGAVLAMNAHGLLITVIAWALIFRDVAMYVSRIVYISKISKLNTLKHLSYLHCILMYVTIVSGFYEMMHKIYWGPPHYFFTNALAFLTLLAGSYASIRFLLIK